MNSFGDFLQGSTVGVNTDEERLRIFARAVVNKKTITGPNVYNNLFVWSNEFVKSSAINLSKGSTAN
jgi:hypothetical protein